MFWRSWIIRNTYHFKTDIDNKSMNSNPKINRNEQQRNEKQRKKREEEMVDIVMEMSGGSYILSKIALEENNMDIFKAINQIKL